MVALDVVEAEVTSPKRVKVQGDLFHGRVPEGAVYVGRQAPGFKRSQFANPFSVKDYGLERALEYYRAVLTPHQEAIKEKLAGQDLACWCKLDQPCHADILLEIANG